MVEETYMTKNVWKHFIEKWGILKWQWNIFTPMLQNGIGW